MWALVLCKIAWPIPNLKIFLLIIVSKQRLLMYFWPRDVRDKANFCILLQSCIKSCSFSTFKLKICLLKCRKSRSYFKGGANSTLFARKIQNSVLFQVDNFISEKYLQWENLSIGSDFSSDRRFSNAIQLGALYIHWE